MADSHSSELSSVEAWKTIPGYPGYEVSDLGRVRSYWRRIGLKGAAIDRGKPPKILKHNRSDNGYETVQLCKGDGQKPRKQIHVLVLEVFVGPKPEGHIACHGAKGREDNSLGNLYWGTYSANNGTDRVRDGTQCRGSSHRNAKLTESLVLDVRGRLKRGERPVDIARALGITPKNVNDVKQKKCWGWLADEEGSLS